jgi:hypothetical protein
MGGGSRQGSRHLESSNDRAGDRGGARADKPRWLRDLGDHGRIFDGRQPCQPDPGRRATDRLGLGGRRKCLIDFPILTFSLREGTTW